jgi:DnaD/phage-associated family protein
MPEITDAAELAVTAYFFFAQSLTRRHPRFLTRRELAADRALVRSLANLAGGRDHDALARGVDLAVTRGTLGCWSLRTGDREEELYAVNTPANRKAMARLAEQGVPLGETPPPAEAEAAPNIFTLYEQNVGNITPLIADDLKEAEQRYPHEWIAAAFREAAELNKRSWRYIERILERWEIEGPAYEKHERDPEAEWLARRYREGKRGAKRSPG